MTRLPESRRGHACAALPRDTAQAFVVAGGFDGHYVSYVLQLLPGAAEWTPLATLPRPLGFAQASIVAGKLWGNACFRSEVIKK